MLLGEGASMRKSTTLRITRRVRLTTGGPFPTTSVAFQQVARGGNATKGPSDAVVAKIAGHTSISISAAKLTFALVVIGTTSMTKTLTVTQQVCSNGIL